MSWVREKEKFYCRETDTYLPSVIYPVAMETFPESHTAQPKGPSQRLLRILLQTSHKNHLASYLGPKEKNMRQPVPVYSTLYFQTPGRKQSFHLY